MQKDVRDLGTQFGVCANSRGATDIHVLDGKVRAELHWITVDKIMATKELTQGYAMRFNGPKASTQPIAIHRGQFVPSWGHVPYKPRIQSGSLLGPDLFFRSDVLFQWRPPLSLQRDEKRSDDHIFLFLESKGITLPREISINITQPGDYQDFNTPPQVLRAGTRVDTYLFHWNQEYRAYVKPITGRVIFPRPVVGIITGAQELVASDGLLGHAGTAYPTEAASRGLEQPPNAEGYDRVILAEDRCTLSITLRAGAMDQLRVLILAASN